MNENNGIDASRQFKMNSKESLKSAIDTLVAEDEEFTSIMIVEKAGGVSWVSHEKTTPSTILMMLEVTKHSLLLSMLGVDEDED